MGVASFPSLIPFIPGCPGDEQPSPASATAPVTYPRRGWEGGAGPLCEASQREEALRSTHARGSGGGGCGCAQPRWKGRRRSLWCPRCPRHMGRAHAPPSSAWSRSSSARAGKSSRGKGRGSCQVRGPCFSTAPPPTRVTSSHHGVGGACRGATPTHSSPLAKSATAFSVTFAA